MDEPTLPAAPDPHRHGRIVLRTVSIWVAIHLGLWLFFGLPRYVDCLGRQCASSLGIVAFLIGMVQLVYGFFLVLVLGIVGARRRDRSHATPITQGIAIACALVFLLSSALCFGKLMARR